MTSDRRIPRRRLVFGAVLVVVSATALYAPTLRLSFAYDDVDLLNRSADLLAGRAEPIRTLFQIHNGHVLPVIRMLFACFAWLFGPVATPLRLVILGAHVLSALFIGLVARRLLGSDLSFVVGALAYVLPSGLSSMWVWFPSAGCVPLGLAGLYAAVAALVLTRSENLRRARAIAAAGVVWMLLCDSSLVPFVVTPALLDEWRRREQGARTRPGVLAIFCAVLGAATVAASWWTLRSAPAPYRFPPLGALVSTSGFLVATAPFRLLFPGSHVPSLIGDPAPSARLLVAWGAVAWLLFASICALALRRYRQAGLGVAMRLLPGCFGWIALVALGRWRTSLPDLWDADRYYFGFLGPLALILTLLAHRLFAGLASTTPSSRVTIAASLGALAVLEIALHRTALVRRVPVSIYDAHARRFAEITDLASRLERETRERGSLALPDADLFFRDVHNNRLSTRFLLTVCDRERSRGLHLASEPVDAASAARLNAVLTDWARAIGEPEPPFHVGDGFLRSSREEPSVDFRIRDAPASVGDGFYAWEGAYRWTGERALLRLRYDGSPTLRLVLAAPVDAIRARRPQLDALRVRARLSFGGDAPRLDPFTIEIRSSTTVEYVVSLPSAATRIPPGSSALLAFRIEDPWRPVDVLPGSGDSRVLGVQVHAAMFR